MFLFGFNILIIVFALIGGAVNKLFNKNFSFWNLQSAFWFGLLLPDIADLYIYPLAVLLGYLSCRYIPLLGAYVSKKMLARYNRKRWGKYIHKKN